jgi:hypothetical protein
MEKSPFGAGGGLVCAVANTTTSPNPCNNIYSSHSNITTMKKKNAKKCANIKRQKWAVSEAWEKYNEFEEYTHYDKSLSLAEFISEWERRCREAVASGVEYSDTVLAFKLLARVHLHDAALAAILRTLEQESLSSSTSRRDWFNVTRSLILNVNNAAETNGECSDGEKNTNENCDNGDKVTNDNSDNGEEGSDNDYYFANEVMAFKQELLEEEDQNYDNNDNNDNSEEQVGEWTAQQQQEQLHICDLCNKSFKTKHYLKEHRVLHTDSRPYKCDLCEEAFNFRSNLRRHKATTHPSTEEANGGRISDRAVLRTSGRRRRRNALHCTKCYLEVESRAALKRHCAKEHGGEGFDSAMLLAEMVCCFCGASGFDSPLALQVRVI